MPPVSPVVHSFRQAWEQQFPDVPWAEQDVVVPLPAYDPAREFTLVFTGLGEYPLIDLVWRDDGPGPSAAMDVVIQPTAQGLGMTLELKGFDSSWLHGFRLRQQGSRRLAGVGCLQRDGVAGWKTVYHSERRTEEFIAFLGRWYEQRSAEEREAVAPLLMLAAQLAFGKVREATHLVDASPHAQAVVAANAWLPAKFGREWITHGFKRTFRFWGEQERADALREAVKIVQALCAVSQDACIFGGAALGLEREGRLLPHDDDLDVLVVVDRERYPDLGTALNAIAAELGRAGWSVVAHFFSHLWVNTRSGPTLDVFVGIAEGDRVSYYPLPRHALDKARLFPCAWSRLEGVDIPVPRDLPYYLQSEYGPQWRVPDAGFRLDWDRRPYADLAGNRSQATLCTRGEIAFVARQNAPAPAAPQVALAA